MTQQESTAARLFVYVGGLTEKAGTADELFGRLKAEPGHTGDSLWVYPDWLRPRTRGHLRVLADTLNQRIERVWADRGSPADIVLVGHSAGGVMLRYAYLCACGELDGHRGDWAAHVRRIVLLAAPNRGLEPKRLTRSVRVAAAVAAKLGRFATLELLAGTPFMTDLRLAWIRYFTVLGDNAPVVVQVRGAEDPLVEREDSRDIEGRVTGADLYLPNATHRDVPMVSGVKEDSEGQRYRILRQAIIGDVPPTTPEPLPAEQHDVTDIVFLLHGIRAGIDSWVADLRRKLEDATGGTALIVTASYGWLSAFTFAVPVTRRRTLRWFQDQYSYLTARHPAANMHFVGHSNGTYMFGQSLDRVRTLRFSRVYLAGSVLPREFAWRDIADRGQVATLVNACGAKDKPVGWLCSGLRGLGMRDVGMGGFTGFNVTPAGTVQFLNLSGGHGAGLTDARLPSVVDYISAGTTPAAATVAPSAGFTTMSRLAPVLAWLLVLVLLGAIAWIAVGFTVVKLAVVLGVLALVYLALKVV